MLFDTECISVNPIICCEEKIDEINNVDLKWGFKWKFNMKFGKYVVVQIILVVARSTFDV